MRPRLLLAGTLGLLLAAVPARPAEGVPGAARPPDARKARGVAGDSQINEYSPDEPSGGERRLAGPAATVARLRDFAENSLARYDQAKYEAPLFRQQGWYPSFFLRDPEADVSLEAGPGGTTLTVEISVARRDIEQRVVVAPVERFLLPAADRQFSASLLAGLAAASQEVARVRLRFWFARLEGDGRLSYELEGALAVPAVAVRRLPPGSRGDRAVWELLEENTVPASLWAEP